MSIPERLLRQLAWIWFVWFSITIPVYAQSSAFQLAQLMQLLAKVETHEAYFTEKKTLVLLTEPLISNGTLRYRRPNYVERNTTSPRPERFTYEHDHITVEAHGRQRRIQADAQPALGALTESIRATLAGDEEALRRHYKLALTGTGENWALELTPVNAIMAQRIRQIRIAGSKEQLRLIEIFEVSGDQTQMTIDPARP
jgi:outer membrane lipoprotein-sorting protein